MRKIQICVTGSAPQPERQVELAALAKRRRRQTRFVQQSKYHRLAMRYDSSQWEVLIGSNGDAIIAIGGRAGSLLEMLIGQSQRAHHRIARYRRRLGRVHR